MPILVRGSAEEAASGGRQGVEPFPAQRKRMPDTSVELQEVKRRLDMRKVRRPLQRGSFLVGLAVLAAIALAVWHFGKDRIRQSFTVGASSEQTLLELTAFRCEADPNGRGGVVTGDVRNVSSEALPLFAQVRVGPSGSPPYNARGIVTPSPLPPRQSGRFNVETPMVVPNDQCRLASFGVSGGGRDLGYRDMSGH